MTGETSALARCLNSPFLTGIRYVVSLLLLPACVGCGEADKKKWDDLWSGGGGFGGIGSSEHEVWTIECNEYRGANHRATADKLAESLRNVTELKGRLVWTHHEEERSLIYCGEYKLKYGATLRSDGPASEPQIVLTDAIKRDLELVRGLAVGEQYPFFSARPLPKPVPDVGPAEWDLQNAKGMYTLNVGVTYATPTLRDYKEAAVEWVRDLRERGYQAYFYHDPVKPRSCICVGTFGEDALIVTPDGRKQLGRAVQELRNKEEEFRYNLENGHKVYRSATGADGKRARMANESILTRIPHKGESRDGGRGR